MLILEQGKREAGRAISGGGFTPSNGDPVFSAQMAAFFTINASV